MLGSKKKCSPRRRARPKVSSARSARKKCAVSRRKKKNSKKTYRSVEASEVEAVQKFLENGSFRAAARTFRRSLSHIQRIAVSSVDPTPESQALVAFHELGMDTKKKGMRRRPAASEVVEKLKENNVVVARSSVQRWLKGIKMKRKSVGQPNEAMTDFDGYERSQRSQGWGS